MKKALLGLLPVLGALAALSLPLRAEIVSSDAPLEWQKVALEEQLQQKITRAISQSIPEKYFAVTVAMDLKAPTVEPPKKEGAKPGAADDKRAEAPPLGKLSIDFSLLLAAQQKEKEKPREAPVNIFNSIKKLDVTVLLDKSLPDSKVIVVKTLTSGVVNSFSKARANVAIQKADLYTDVEALKQKVEEEDDEDDAAREPASTPSLSPMPAPSVTPVVVEKKPPPEPWDAQRWIMELKYPVGFLVSVVFFGFFFLSAFKSFMGIQGRKIALLESKNQREEFAFQKNRQTSSASGHSAGPQSDEEVKALEAQLEKGFQRFRDLLAASPERAGQLIRQWLRNPKKGASEALSVLPQVLKMEELNQLFEHLGGAEKKEWRRFLTLPMGPGAFKIADAFVASQIVDNYLTPSLKMDDDILEQVNALSLTDCVDLAKQDSQLGAILANVLPSGQVARMFALLPAELAAEVTQASITMTDDEIVRRSNTLKSAIAALKAKMRPVRFLDSASELLGDIGPERENAIFSALAEAGEYRALEAAARQFFPAELVGRLPSFVLKTCLDSMSPERRAELIYSKEGAEREALLEVYGKAGGRAREMMDLELDMVAKDEVRKKRAERNRSALWKELTEVCRERIRTDESIAEIAEIALKDWLFAKSNGEVGEKEVTRAA